MLHAVHYLLGRQTREALENFRGFGGAQCYPSRTKDAIPVDFSTGSVGLGVAITLFASLVQDYLAAHGLARRRGRGRFVAPIGDAELDEGNIYEALSRATSTTSATAGGSYYNSQSLDATSADRMFERFDDIFRDRWRVDAEVGQGPGGAFARERRQGAAALDRGLPNAAASPRSPTKAATPGAKRLMREVGGNPMRAS